MPIRFYRRFYAGPFRLNVSAHGISTSIRRRAIPTSIGIPSSGLGYYEQRRLPRPANDDDLPTLPRPHRCDWLAIIGISALIMTMLALIWR